MQHKQQQQINFNWNLTFRQTLSGIFLPFHVLVWTFLFTTSMIHLKPWQLLFFIISRDILESACWYVVKPRRFIWFVKNFRFIFNFYFLTFMSSLPWWQKDDFFFFPPLNILWAHFSQSIFLASGTTFPSEGWTHLVCTHQFLSSLFEHTA